MRSGSVVVTVHHQRSRRTRTERLEGRDRAEGEGQTRVRATRAREGTSRFLDKNSRGGGGRRGRQGVLTRTEEESSPKDFPGREVPCTYPGGRRPVSLLSVLRSLLRTFFRSLLVLPGPRHPSQPPSDLFLPPPVSSRLFLCFSASVSRPASRPEPRLFSDVHLHPSSPDPGCVHGSTGLVSLGIWGRRLEHRKK